MTDSENAASEEGKRISLLIVELFEANDTSPYEVLNILVHTMCAYFKTMNAPQETVERILDTMKKNYKTNFLQR